MTRQSLLTLLDKRFSVEALEPEEQKSKSTRDSWLRCLKAQLETSRWYKSAAAQGVRKGLDSYLWRTLLLCSLAIALFLPDLLFVLPYIEDTTCFVLLGSAMAVLLADVIALSAVDVSYCCSVMLLLDMIGSLSILIEIAIIHMTLGKPAVLDSPMVDAELTLLRLARFAKAGAHIARMTRSVRILRFLPGLRKPVPSQKDAGPTGVCEALSIHLANMMAARIAVLSSVLVVSIVLFDLPTFPTVDRSFAAWTDRLARQLHLANDSDLSAELELMTHFYSSYEYGPHAVCVATLVDGEAFCNPDSQQPAALKSYKPRMSAPANRESDLHVISGDLLIRFNILQPQALDGFMSVGVTVLLVVIMAMSSLSLCTVMTELVIRPVSSLLKAALAVADEQFGIEIPDIFASESPQHIHSLEESEELIFIKSVVEKLHVVTDTEHLINDEMCDEDKGILSLVTEDTHLRGKSFLADSSRAIVVNTLENARDVGKPSGLQFRDLGVDLRTFQKLEFNSSMLSDDQMDDVVVYVISNFAEPGAGYVQDLEHEEQLMRFVKACHENYKPNPFHNFAHAADVAYNVSRMLGATFAASFLTELEQFALLISAVGHDIGHPGLNNVFLVETGDALATKYNDISPLENFHCAMLFRILSRRDQNMFKNLSRQEFKEARKVCVETILHTDMVQHNAMVKKLKGIYEMNTDVFLSPPDPKGNTPEELEILADADTKLALMQSILHTADVSNPCRAWDVSCCWAHLCLDEFFAQGDKEKALGVPVSFLNDREKVCRPHSQLGFIEFMIAPLVVSMIRIWPELSLYGKCLADNMEDWMALWLVDAKPGQDERDKVRARTQQIRQLVDDASTRA
eukprot:TRINITY_DN49748_c0_g2_i1.p1 TRINITY_DN49748_c0_g2~~TRINITY_DN49748_c0_g2_i1.p1  ORF type:complete len:857 (-),score=131.72 TRINITY_DN49748_c0_g2_i1:102-2672(-)